MKSNIYVTFVSICLTKVLAEWGTKKVRNVINWITENFNDLPKYYSCRKQLTTLKIVKSKVTKAVDNCDKDRFFSKMAHIMVLSVNKESPIDKWKARSKS